MASDHIVTDDVLVRVHDEVVRRAALLGRVIPASPSGEALAHALLFEHWPELIDPLLDPIVALYNQYYWFARYVASRTRDVGEDAGLEQQLFDILATTGLELDYEVVESIEQRARRLT